MIKNNNNDNNNKIIKIVIIIRFDWCTWFCMYSSWAAAPIHSGERDQNTTFFKVMLGPSQLNGDESDFENMIV